MILVNRGRCAPVGGGETRFSGDGRYAKKETRKQKSAEALEMVRAPLCDLPLAT